MFKSLYSSLSFLGDSLQSILLLAIRLYWGYQFFISGCGKLGDIQGTAEFFTDLAIPMPVANAYIAGGVEFFGGALLIIGLFARLISIPLAIVMITAYVTAHMNALHSIWSDPSVFVAEQPFNFLLAALIVFAFGPGKISLDYLLFGRKENKY